MAGKRSIVKGDTSAIDGALWEIKLSLDQLGFDVSHGKYPATMLKDVKLAVDDLRLALWAVMELNEREEDAEARGSPNQFRQKVAEFRMKRLERMLNDLRMDLTKGAVPGDVSSVKTLASSLQATLDSITRLTHGKA